MNTPIYLNKTLYDIKNKYSPSDFPILIKGKKKDLSNLEGLVIESSFDLNREMVTKGWNQVNMSFSNFFQEFSLKNGIYVSKESDFDSHIVNRLCLVYSPNQEPFFLKKGSNKSKGWYLKFDS